MQQAAMGRGGEAHLILIYAKEVELGIGGGGEGGSRKQSLTGSDATSRAMRSPTSTACREPAHATFIASTSKRTAALSAAWWSTSAAASMATSVGVETKSSEMPPAGKDLGRPGLLQLLNYYYYSSSSPRSIWLLE
jgi:hypothetical protein